MPSPSSPSRSAVLARRGLIVAAVTVGVLVLGFLAWAASPMIAEARPLAMAQSDPGFTYTETADAVVLTPTEPTGTGLVFVSGARVEPAAYAYKLGGLADAGVTVVIARPTLNFAIFDQRPLSAFTALAPRVPHWFVGGHSLGGVRACALAASGDETGVDVAGLILFGAYCADDLSDSALPVLSLVGEHDGLSTPAKVADAAHLLPADAQVVELAGASHASFGDYGPQPGDGTPTASDADVREAITVAISAFLDEVDGH